MLHLNNVCLEKINVATFCELTRLKNKIESNSTWEGAFYQSKWVKINSSLLVKVIRNTSIRTVLCGLVSK